jgi:serine/threonine protein kinase
MTIPQKVSTLYQIACGAEHMHSHKIVHRDLSDMNILLCSNGCVKIADLGCARQLNDTTYKPSTISGSPPYMAPEQLQGKSITLKVDVWALGVLLWEIVTEQKPWENAKPTARNKLGGLEYMQKHVIQQKKDLPQVTWPQMAGVNILKAIYFACLDRDATTRFTMLDVRDCLSELNEHVNGRMPASEVAQLRHLLEADLRDFYKKFNQAKIKTIAQAVSENGVSRAVLNAKLRIRYGVSLDSFKSSQSAEQDTLIAKSVGEGHRDQAKFSKQVDHEQMLTDAAVVGGGGADALGDGVEFLQRVADLWNDANQEVGLTPDHQYHCRDPRP